MSVFYDLSKTPRNILNKAIVRAIVSENNGLLFDIGDMSTLYQDAAGTIPVTAVGQPVGKILDKSGNGYHATQSITASRPTLIYENGMYGLQFDGIDDYLNLPYMGLYANGSASVVMAKSADYQINSPTFLVETSSTTTTPTYLLLGGFIQPYSLGAYIRNDAGVTTANTRAVLTGDVQSTAHIVTITDTGSVIKRFNNSSIADSDTYTRANPLTVDRTVVGAFYAGALIYNKAIMKMYGLIITKSALTDAQRIKCERFLARKAGVML